jgi:hypothetical protein
MDLVDHQQAHFKLAPVRGYGVATWSRSCRE